MNNVGINLFYVIGMKKVGKIIEKVVEDASSFEVSENTSTVKSYSPEEALAFICKNNFSKAQYMDIRLNTLQNGADMYPAYNRILEVKSMCYPSGKY